MIYKSVTRSFRQKFDDLISPTKNILITGHHSPDDDAVSSPLSLAYYLRLRNPQKKIDVAYTGSRVDRYEIFTGYKDANFTKDIADIIAKYDLVIFLDGSQYYRFSNKPDIITSLPINTICIDHHSSPPEKFDLAVITPKATSTAEIVYSLIGSKNIDRPLSELLLLGILGDTGTFNYVKPGQYHIFSIVKKLLKIGNIEIQDYKSKYSLISPDEFGIIREFIKNSQFLKVKGWPDFMVSFIDRQYIKNNKITDSQLSEASEFFVAYYLRLIKGYSWGFSVKPYSDGSCSLSFRSLPKSVSVRDLAERMSIGGGHDRAAGAKIKPILNPVQADEAIKTIITWMKQNKPRLI